MSNHYDVPGVYIEEQTGPGVITGVGTSTAAFIGPALRGPINEARRISSFDEFLRNYGITLADGRQWAYITEPRNFYMAHAVRGFFQNGGRQAYIVRAGTGIRSSLAVLNQAGAGEPIFIVEAQQEGVAGDGIQVATELAATQGVVVGTTGVTGVDRPGPPPIVVTVASATPFRVGDIVTDDIVGDPPATVMAIHGNDMTLDTNLPNLTGGGGENLRIADIPPTQDSFRLIGTASLYPGGMALISGDDAGAPGITVTERVEVQSVDSATGFVTLAAAPARVTTYNLNLAPAYAPTFTSIRGMVVGSAGVTGADRSGPNPIVVTVADATIFRVGDVVTDDIAGDPPATVIAIQGNDLALDTDLPNLTGGGGENLRIADVPPTQNTFRVNDITGLYPGSFIQIEGDDANNPGNTTTDYAIIEAVDPVGFVTLRSAPARVNTFNLNVAQGSEPILIPQEFRLIIIPPTTSGRPSGRINNLSTDPFHPRYIFNESILNDIADFDSTIGWVQVVEPDVPPLSIIFPGRLVALIGATPLTNGQDDQPTALTSIHYQDGLNVLRDIDDVNLICIPDAASHPEHQTIQQAMISHCLLAQLQDRFAILDSWPNVPHTGPRSVEEQRAQVQADRGFAALYYPWLEVRDPTSTGPIPRSIFIPPSGHIVGVFARTDGERGVHKAPANTNVRGILGLERVLSDGQHGPLNLAGINGLRIFPGSTQITVWGARTTVDPNITDWLYVNVRRLMLYIEESIEEGIRWAVFEPNNLALWQKLKRTITDFLTRVWRDGALFGDSPDKAFYVRIDEALNPPSTRAIGRLYIEIGVAPVRPAEFIIVRIGLWDGGSEVAES